MPTGIDCGSHSSPTLDELINARAPEGSHGFTDQYIHANLGLHVGRQHHEVFSTSHVHRYLLVSCMWDIVRVQAVHGLWGSRSVSCGSGLPAGCRQPCRQSRQQTTTTNHMYPMFALFFVGSSCPVASWQRRLSKCLPDVSRAAPSVGLTWIVVFLRTMMIFWPAHAAHRLVFVSKRTVQLPSQTLELARWPS